MSHHASSSSPISSLRSIHSERATGETKSGINNKSNINKTTNNNNNNDNDDDDIPGIRLVSLGDYEQDAKIYSQHHAASVGRENAPADAALDNVPLLYLHQGTLRRLPVPGLKETIERWLPTALPLAKSDLEATTAQQAAHDFPIQAAALQQALLHRQALNANSSWLQKWWNQIVYLQDRNSNVLHMSYMYRQVFEDNDDDHHHHSKVHPVDTTTRSTPITDHWYATLPQHVRHQALVHRTAVILHAVGQLALDIAHHERLRPDGMVVQHRHQHHPKSSVTSLDKQQEQQNQQQQHQQQQQQPILCSTQFQYVLGTCRIPAPEQDQVVVYEPARHVILAVQNRFYRVNILNRETGHLHSISQLESDLMTLLQEAILNRSSLSVDRDERLVHLGWFTGTNRNTWADVYHNLLLVEGGPRMQSALHTLQSALCVVCWDLQHLQQQQCGDSTQPLNDQDWTRQIWHGHIEHSANRWHDKSVQLILTDIRPEVGLIGEHCMADGMPVLRIWYEIKKVVAAAHFEFLRKQQSIQSNDGPAPTTTTTISAAAAKDQSTHRVKHVFHDAFADFSGRSWKHLEESIDLARNDLLQRITDHDMMVLHYKGYGRTEIKGNIGRRDGSSSGGYAPDAFVQMALQLAGLQVFGETVATYESTHTRRFLHGRTETTRTVSPASVAFCQAMKTNMKNNLATIGTECSERQKARISPDVEAFQELESLFRKAVDQHVAFTRSALEGHGVDRHLFGLSMILSELQNQQKPNDIGASSPESSTAVVVPDLFQHPLYIKSKRWRMSTSTLPGTAPGFGNVESDGVGIAYDVRNHDMIFTIAGRVEYKYVTAMHAALIQALDVMHIFLESPMNNVSDSDSNYTDPPLQSKI